MGERIGRYDLREPLGRGAFATVWAAHDEALDIPVAIKVLADNWSLDEGVRERFLAEARLLRRISSPRVVRVHDIGEIDGKPYFVMDQVEGGTLADVITTGVEPAEGLRLAAQTAYAVHELHLAGVAHRDVKPSNLLVDRTGPLPRVVVTDLGTAKPLSDGSGFTMTAGTPAYMAPEQVHGEHGIDERADVYGVGVVAYELLTGRKPFEVKEVLDVSARTTELRPGPVADFLRLPGEVDTLLQSALSRRREDRPADAQVLGDALAVLADRLDRPNAERAKPASDWAPRTVLAAAVAAFAGSAAIAGAITWFVVR